MIGVSRRPNSLSTSCHDRPPSRRMGSDGAPYSDAKANVAGHTLNGVKAVVITIRVYSPLLCLRLTGRKSAAIVRFCSAGWF